MLPGNRVLLGLISFSTFAAPASAQWSTDWQMIAGREIDKFPGWDKVFDHASPPEIDALGWRRCPCPRTISWDVTQPGPDQPRPASFHYFQTILMFPEKGRSCQLRVWKSKTKGSIEVSVFNHKNPFGQAVARLQSDAGTLAKNGEELIDLTPHLRSGYTRVVISHNDGGAARAALRARVEIDGQPADEQDIIMSVVRDNFRISRRGAIYAAGGTDPEWEAGRIAQQERMEKYWVKEAEILAAQAEERSRRESERHYRELESSKAQAAAAQAWAANQAAASNQVYYVWRWRYPTTTRWSNTVIRYRYYWVWR